MDNDEVLLAKMKGWSDANSSCRRTSLSCRVSRAWPLRSDLLRHTLSGSLFRESAARCDRDRLRSTLRAEFPGKVGLDRCNSPRKRLAIHVVQQHFKSGCRGPGRCHGPSCRRRSRQWFQSFANRYLGYSSCGEPGSHTEATRFDYPNIRSYTIRSTEKAIVLIPNMHEKRTST